jgi:hypothetical protein
MKTELYLQIMMMVIMINILLDSKKKFGLQMELKLNKTLYLFSFVNVL